MKSTTATEIRHLLTRGRSTAEAGHWDVARRCFAQVLGLDPNNEEALLWQGGLAEDPQESIIYLKRALRVNPDSDRAQAGLRWAQQRLPGRPPPTDASEKKHATRPLCLLLGLLVVLALLCVAWRVGTLADHIEAVRTFLVPPTTTPTATADDHGDAHPFTYQHTYCYAHQHSHFHCHMHTNSYLHTILHANAGPAHASPRAWRQVDRRRCLNANPDRL